MGFTLQGFGPFLHWLTLGILCVLPLLAAFVLYKLGGLPGTIARSRSHPQAEAINVCGWMGVITIVLWPIAMVWAYLRPGTSPVVEGLSQNNANSVVGRLQQASQRIEALERRLPTK
jgi:hypothetical protein